MCSILADISANFCVRACRLTLMCTLVIWLYEKSNILNIYESEGGRGLDLLGHLTNKISPSSLKPQATLECSFNNLVNILKHTLSRIHYLCLSASVST